MGLAVCESYLTQFLDFQRKSIFRYSKTNGGIQTTFEFEQR